MIQRADFLAVHHVRDIVREYLTPGEYTVEIAEDLVGAIVDAANDRLPDWEVWHPYVSEFYSEKDEEISEEDFRELLEAAAKEALQDW